METWLHQHFFKVGWLITLNIYRLGWKAQGQGDRFALDPSQNQRCLQATTILYYSFFLPGVILNQFIYWFTAGVLNIRAARKIAWPKAQDIGELKLDFVDLGKVSPLQQAVVSTAPFAVALGFIWFVANSILDVNGFLSILRGEADGDLWTAVSRLTATPDFWLWVYLLFAVSNTMIPDYKNLKGWRTVLIIVGVITVGLFLLTNGSEAVFLILTGPIAEGLSVVAGVFAVIIAVDVVAVALLGTIESIIERITGDSATFKNGKMITMRREELVKLREQERQREQQARQQAQKQRAMAPAGPPSIYKLPLPIPGTPGRETIQSDAITVSKEEAPALASSTMGEGKAGASLIAGAPVIKHEAEAAPAHPTAARQFPSVTPPSPFARSSASQEGGSSPVSPDRPAAPVLSSVTGVSPYSRPPSSPIGLEQSDEDTFDDGEESDVEDDELPDDRMLMGDADDSTDSIQTTEQPTMTDAALLGDEPDPVVAAMNTSADEEDAEEESLD